MGKDHPPTAVPSSVLPGHQYILFGALHTVCYNHLLISPRARLYPDSGRGHLRDGESGGSEGLSDLPRDTQLGDCGPGLS